VEASKSRRMARPGSGAASFAPIAYLVFSYKGRSRNWPSEKWKSLSSSSPSFDPLQCSVKDSSGRVLPVRFVRRWQISKDFLSQPSFEGDVLYLKGALAMELMVPFSQGDLDAWRQGGLDLAVSLPGGELPGDLAVPAFFFEGFADRLEHFLMKPGGQELEIEG